MQKRATKVQASPNSGGIYLRGVDPGYATDVPTFNIVVAAGGNSVTATLNSGNAALFEYIRVQVSDSKGKSASGLYAGAPIVINTTNVSKASSSVYPNITIAVVYKLKDGVTLKGDSPELNYQVPVDAASMVAGITINTALRFNTTDRGAQISIAAEYTTGPDQTTIDVTAISAIGLTFEVFENGVSVGTLTIGTDGTGQLVSSATLAPGDYTYKAICTTAGAAQNSFAEVTITV